MPRAIDGPWRAKTIGNGLRELDRFLNILIGEVAACHGLAMHRDERNTANKLTRFRAALRLPDPDHDRLRAIGRTRACLFHCGGIVRRADRAGGTMMTTGWLDRAAEAPTLWKVPVGGALVVTARELGELCQYYDGIARSLMILHPGMA